MTDVHDPTIPIVKSQPHLNLVRKVTIGPKRLDGMSFFLVRDEHLVNNFPDAVYVGPYQGDPRVNWDVWLDLSGLINNPTP